MTTFADLGMPFPLFAAPTQEASEYVGLTSGNTDYRITDRGGRPPAEWTWEAMDEMDPCTGRGWAVLEDNDLHGMIFFHQGDESGFVARRPPKRPRSKRK